MIDDSTLDEAMAVLDELPAANERREQLGRECRNSDFDATVQRLRELSASDPVAFERQRRLEARRLGIRTTRLDRALADCPRSTSKDLPGSSLHFPETEPWPEPVIGTLLFDELTAAFNRHLVLPDGAAEAISLSVVFSHCLDSFRFNPRLAFLSPTKQCGKTTALGMLVELVARALPASNVTPAVIFRIIESVRPTLLIDEADAFLPENEALRGVLNSGHSRSTAYILRTVGEDFEPRSFSTWAPIVIACIGKLPGTLMDRSIVVQMRRKTAFEVVHEFDDDARETLARLKRRIVRWIADNGESLAGARPVLPEGFGNRLADNWRPLLALADAAGGHWPERARNIARRLSDTEQEDADSKVILLADIRRIFMEQATTKLFSESICEALAAIEDRPWAEWSHGKPISKHGLARLLKAFDILPHGSIRIGSATGKGYDLSDFREAFERYLPPQTVTTSQPLGENEFATSRNVTLENDVTDSNISLVNAEKGCDVVTDGIPQVSVIYESSLSDQRVEEF